MAIQKRFIHFKKFSDFNSKKLSANEANTQYTVGVSGAVQNGEPDILYGSYVWIKDTQQQWTHGQLYDCSSTSADSSEYTQSTIEITYSDLVNLRDSENLIPDQKYRIIDYETRTAQKNTRSADHLFDLIVTATDNKTLSEHAQAVESAREDSTHFSNQRLSAWKIWYTLDNDSARFSWADEANGKGVIYRMIDEWNNDCNYDFKNIQFLREYVGENSVHAHWQTTTDTTKTWMYTFTEVILPEKSIRDASCNSYRHVDDGTPGCFDNTVSYIEAFLLNHYLSNNVIIINTDVEEGSYNSAYGITLINSTDNTIDYCSNVTFNESHWNNLVRSMDIQLNTGCHRIFLYDCVDVKFGRSCNNCDLLSGYNVVFNDLVSNISFDNEQYLEDGYSAKVSNYIIKSGVNSVTLPYSFTSNGETVVGLDSNGQVTIYCAENSVVQYPFNNRIYARNIDGILGATSGSWYLLPDEADGSEDHMLLSNQTVKTINGNSIVGSGDVNTQLAYAEYTGTATAAVVTTKYGYFPTTLVEGASVAVKFEGSLTYITTLNVNGTGAKNVYYKGNSLSSGTISRYNTYIFVYDGSYYRIVGIDTDTHYTAKNVVTSSSTSKSNATATNGNVYLNAVENSTVRSTHKIVGTGATTVTSDSSGNITINTPGSYTWNASTAVESGTITTTEYNAIANASNVLILLDGAVTIQPTKTNFGDIVTLTHMSIESPDSTSIGVMMWSISSSGAYTYALTEVGGSSGNIGAVDPDESLGDVEGIGNQSVIIDDATIDTTLLRHNTMLRWMESGNSESMSLEFPTNDGETALNCGFLLQLTSDASSDWPLYFDGVELYWANDTIPDIEPEYHYEMWFTSYNGGTTWYGVFTKYKYN